MEQLDFKNEPPSLFDRTGDYIFRDSGQRRQVRRHALIFSPGDNASHIYMVGHGEVKISRYTPEGRELTLDHLGPGEVFGEMEILLERARESQALARTDCILYQLEKEMLSSLIETDPQFSLWLTRIMGQRQAKMENWLESLLFKSANGKVAQILLQLARNHGVKISGGTLIDYPITHQEIGNLIATTRETVSYAFMEFRQRGLISTRQRKTIVHDLERLGEVALI